MYVCMCMAAVSTLYFSLFQFPICQERESGGVGRDWNLRGALGMKGAAGITATSRSAAVAARSGLFSLFTALGKTKLVKKEESSGISAFFRFCKWRIFLCRFSFDSWLPFPETSKLATSPFTLEQPFILYPKVG